MLVEVDCKTDFVARNDDFIAFARDVALHIAGDARPCSTSADDEVPEEAKEAELRVFEQQAADKPENVRAEDRRGQAATSGSRTSCCCNQAHVNADKHEGKTIEQLRAELSAKTGENVVIRRFARFAVGE